MGRSDQSYELLCTHCIISPIHCTCIQLGLVPGANVSIFSQNKLCAPGRSSFADQGAVCFSIMPKCTDIKLGYDGRDKATSRRDQRWAEERPARLAEAAAKREQRLAELRNQTRIRRRSQTLR